MKLFYLKNRIATYGQKLNNIQMECENFIFYKTVFIKRMETHHSFSFVNIVNVNSSCANEFS